MSRKGKGAPPPPEPSTAEVAEVVARGSRVYTRGETARQYEAAEGALIAGVGERATVERVVAETGCTRSRARVMVRRVYERWEQEDSEKRATWKSAQIRRLLMAARLALHGRDAVVREGVVVRAAVRPNLQAHGRYEELLARVMGTSAPIEVTVAQTQHVAVAAVLAEIDPKDFADLLERAERGLAVVEGPALPPPPPAEPKVKPRREFDA